MSTKTRTGVVFLFSIWFLGCGLAFAAGEPPVAPEAAKTGDINARLMQGLEQSQRRAADLDEPALAEALTTMRFDRPIPMGVSISTTPTLPFISAGTAGMRVRSLFNPNFSLILSNNHVMGAAPPDLCPDTAPIGTWVLQPGTLDIGFDPGNDPFYLAGFLIYRAPLDPSPTASNLIDAALALTSPTVAGTEILNIGDPSPVLDFPAPGMQVTKTGRTTETTTGTVLSINGTFVVGYGAGCNNYRFVGQTSISPGSFSAGGDSGSVILNAANLNPVGLLFAGSPTMTIANPIHFVYFLMGVFVDTPTPATGVAELTRQMQDRMEDPVIVDMMAVQQRAEEQVFKNPGVNGFAIGMDQGGSDHSFIVYCDRVTRALRRSIPKQIGGFPVRLYDTGGPIRAFGAR